MRVHPVIAKIGRPPQGGPTRQIMAETRGLGPLTLLIATYNWSRTEQEIRV
jgi:hypothetical protein